MNDETDQDQETRDEQHNCFGGGVYGWGLLIAELEAKLRALSPDYTISQVKEKFGGLRYYANPGAVDAETSKRFYDLIREAEAQADETCECCGQAGRLAQGGQGNWYKTFCSRCCIQRNFEPVGEDAGSEMS